MNRIIGSLAAALIAVMAFTAPGLTAAKKKGPDTPLPSNQYATETEAKSHCATDVVVWANLSSKIYHLAGTRSYGTTKRGAYMCRAEADNFGFRGVRSRTPTAKGEPKEPKAPRVPRAAPKSAPKEAPVEAPK